jgi:23S rRNA (guanosine2251-2'-O)-methyltransferase
LLFFCSIVPSDLPHAATTALKPQFFPATIQTLFHVQQLDSLDLPELAPYRTLRYQQEQRQQGIFVAESEKTVRRLLDSPLAVVSVLLPEELLASFQPALERRAEIIHVFTGGKKLLEKLTGFPMYQGVMAVGKVPSQPTLESLLQSAPRPLLFVAADGLSNAQNMGVLARNCAAFSAHALLAGETCCSPWLRRSVASSVGTIFRLPALELADLATTLRQLRGRGIRCLAADPHESSRTLADADLAGDCCIVLGSEGEGIRPAVRDACDAAFAIPMPPHMDSLNVGSASAVILYEAARQRGSLVRSAS